MAGCKLAGDRDAETIRADALGGEASVDPAAQSSSFTGDGSGRRLNDYCAKQIIENVLASGQQIQLIQGDDNLEAGQKFLQISQAIERIVGEKLLPEPGRLETDQGVGKGAAIVHARLL